MMKPNRGDIAHEPRQHPPQHGEIHPQEHEKYRIAHAYQEIHPCQNGHILAHIFCELSHALDDRRTRIHTQAGGCRQRQGSADHKEEDRQSQAKLNQYIEHTRQQSLCNRSDTESYLFYLCTRLRAFCC